MSYIRAEDVLPEYVLDLVQQYIDGEMIYIPRKGSKRSWGSGTDIRQELKSRNEQMYAKYLSGVTVSELADCYCLTEKSVRRIIRNCKV